MKPIRKNKKIKQQEEREDLWSREQTGNERKLSRGFALLK
jgi:hypothetical protein